MSYPPPSGDPTSPYEPSTGGFEPATAPTTGHATGPAGLGQPPPGGHPWIDYPTAPYPYPQEQYPPPPPQEQYPQAGYPPTAAFPTYQPDAPPDAPPGTPPPGTPPPDPQSPPPRRSNVPLVAVILACVLLLCGGAVVAGVLVVRNVVTGAKDAVSGLPTGLPTLPTDLPGVPTDLPTLPTDLPGLPTDLPGLPGLPTGGPDNPGRTVQVTYEVDGDGPAEITYLLRTGDAPRTVRNATLPWRLTVTMTGLSLASVVAVRVDTTPGTIRCRTTVDGAAAVERTGEGSLAVAACPKLILD